MQTAAVDEELVDVVAAIGNLTLKLCAVAVCAMVFLRFVLREIQACRGSRDPPKEALEGPRVEDSQVARRLGDIRASFSRKYGICVLVILGAYATSADPL